MVPDAKRLRDGCLKVINCAGHELHAADPEAAVHYNLRILYRRAGAKRAATDNT